MHKFAISVVALVVAGCVVSPRGTVYHVDDPFQFFSYAGSRGVIPVMVVGDPYPGRRAQVEAVALAALDGNFKSLGNPFRAVPPVPGEGTKVILTFNVPNPPLPTATCKDPTAVAPHAPGPVTTVNALYCGVGPYSEYQVSFDTPGSPESPEFRARMSELLYNAIPREINPSRRHSNEIPPP